MAGRDRRVAGEHRDVAHSEPVQGLQRRGGVVAHLLMVRPGGVVPVDGGLEGEPAWFDESSITGESMPVEHVPGDQVLSGSVVQHRVALVRAGVPAKDSQYQQIIDLVESAARSRSPIVRLADRYALPFTIVSLATAAVAWWLSGDPVRFAQVLVVATPCPLLIAAPVAFLAGMSHAASSGVVVKSGGVMETLARVRTVAVDKTGTLTHGRPVVDVVEPADGTSAADLLGVAAAAEAFSGHVLARTIVDAARHRHLSVPAASGVEESTAAGMTATVDGRLTAVGSAAHLIAVTGHEPPERAVPPGHIAVHIGTSDGYLGRILLIDQVTRVHFIDRYLHEGAVGCGPVSDPRGAVQQGRHLAMGTAGGVVLQRFTPGQHQHHDQGGPVVTDQHCRSDRRDRQDVQTEVASGQVADHGPRLPPRDSHRVAAHQPGGRRRLAERHEHKAGDADTQGGGHHRVPADPVRCIHLTIIIGNATDFRLITVEGVEAG